MAAPQAPPQGKMGGLRRRRRRPRDRYPVLTESCSRTTILDHYPGSLSCARTTILCFRAAHGGAAQPLGAPRSPWGRRCGGRRAALGVAAQPLGGSPRSPWGRRAALGDCRLGQHSALLPLCAHCLLRLFARPVASTRREDLPAGNPGRRKRGGSILFLGDSPRHARATPAPVTCDPRANAVSTPYAFAQQRLSLLRGWRVSGDALCLKENIANSAAAEFKNPAERLSGLEKLLSAGPSPKAVLAPGPVGRCGSPVRSRHHRSAGFYMFLYLSRLCPISVWPGTVQPNPVRPDPFVVVPSQSGRSGPVFARQLFLGEAEAQNVRRRSARACARARARRPRQSRACLNTNGKPRDSTALPLEPSNAILTHIGPVATPRVTVRVPGQVRAMPAPCPCHPSQEMPKARHARAMPGHSRVLWTQQD
eukprot:gene18762-biopygen18990